MSSTQRRVSMPIIITAMPPICPRLTVIAPPLLTVPHVIQVRLVVGSDGLGDWLCAYLGANRWLDRAYEAYTPCFQLVLMALEIPCCGC